jgi:hypothetical protein
LRRRDWHMPVWPSTQEANQGPPRALGIGLACLPSRGVFVTVGLLVLSLGALPNK